MRPLVCTAALLAMLSLSACGERDQAMASGRHKSPDEPWRGAKNGFVVNSWAPSDKAGWETQLRQRTQAQNEYNKIN